MPLPDRFCVDIPEPVPTYSYDYVYQPTVSYQYPCESTIVYRVPSVSYYTPCEVVVRNDTKSETAAIRRDLRQIRTDLNQLKRQSACPTYYELKEVKRSCCDACQEKTHSGAKIYCCVEKPTYSFMAKLRPKTPNTTYQDSYRPHSCIGYPGRRITLNELQTESESSTGPVQHPRPWIPPGHKNQYPCRQWNLSVPHSEP